MGTATLNRGTAARFVCGNSATLDGEPPDQDSPCKLERVTGTVAEITVVGQTAHAHRGLAKKAGWVYRKKVMYCPSCGR